MTTHKTPIATKRVGKAISAGLITSVVTAAVMAVALKTGLSPLPQPLGLAFAQWVVGQPLPLPVGLLFHTAYVTGLSTLFILLAPRYLRFLPILGFGLLLWLVAVSVFTPLVGWGFAATGVAGVKGVPATLIPHLLFSLVLWLSCLGLFRTGKTG
ncbi:hypothetical protein [Marinobacter gelidimuriae]|uniref:hypothetical protein n=1 Tax=Marinobacter gelidimuriae TaxID=2739064 RepID=UPI00036E54A9|nr:hypothetical protein [Marinobacter gelidimuriae]